MNKKNNALSLAELSDPANPLPLYEEIKRYVLEQIKRGAWKVGDRIPSEQDLARRFNASRLTVHRALRELSQRDIVSRVQGVGTFVCQSKAESAFVRIQNIAEEIRARGQRFSSLVVRLETVLPPDDIAANLEIGSGEKLHHSLIVYSTGDMPAQLEDRYVAAWFAPHYVRQDFTRQSTTDYLQAIASPTDAENVIEAVSPDALTRKLLKLEKGEPCLAVMRKTWVKGNVTTYTRFLYPGFRHRIVTRVGSE
jgi:GntR family histidine utilization transcriptional repressor